MADYLITMMSGDKFLCHHGVKGQKWGVWNEETRNRYMHESRMDDKTLSKVISKSHSSNIDKWGKSKDTNALYITGYSGSGKTSVALSLAGPKDKVVHLDAFVEDISEKTSRFRDPDFVKYLDKHVPDWKDVTVSNMSNKDYWDTVEKFDKAIEGFSRETYGKGGKVIVEGVQIADKWLKGKGSDYKGKPLMVLNTNAVTSMSRAFDRDGRGNLLKGLAGLDDPKQYLKWVYDTNRHMKEINKENQSTRTGKWR